MIVYNCKIPGNINNVSCVVKDVVQCLQSVYGFIEECTLFELKVILNELILNAIKHGNKEDDSKFVKILVGLTKKDNAILLIEDCGKGFNYRCLMEMDQNDCIFDDICEMKETGRGILIVKNLSDRMKFNGKGNRVVIVKKLCRR